MALAGPAAACASRATVPGISGSILKKSVPLDRFSRRIYPEQLATTELGVHAGRERILSKLPWTSYSTSSSIPLTKIYVLFTVLRSCHVQLESDIFEKILSGLYES
jgi:hypothetical protein